MTDSKWEIVKELIRVEFKKPLSNLEGVILVVIVLLLVPICFVLSSIACWGVIAYSERLPNAKVSYSGQLNGRLDAKGEIRCFTTDGLRYPHLSLGGPTENSPDFVIAIDLPPDIRSGTHRFTSTSPDTRFWANFYDASVSLESEDLISGEITFKELPDRDYGPVKGDFEVVYPNMTVKGTFSFTADAEFGPYDCWGQ